ncbi:MAG: DUF58 domain-containing protein [Coriobacteriales bacterium]|jgi:uncharacterized protein (DUF58 family)
MATATQSETLRGVWPRRRGMSGERAVRRTRKREERKREGSRIGRPWRFVKRHRKVAVKVLLVILALFFSALPIIFVNNAIGYMGLITVVFIIGISFAYLQVVKRALSIDESSLMDECERGSEVTFTIKFKNSSPLIVTRFEPTIYISDLFGGFESEETVRMMLMPHETFEYHFDARFVHIGDYSAGVSRMVISDLLGLFSATIVNEKRHPVSVRPRIFDLASVDIADNALVESAKVYKPTITDAMDYAGVREYHVGDPMKTVHWKLSARMGDEQLYTRIYETHGNPGLTVIIDPYAPEWDVDSLMHVFDGLVESALSVCLYAHELGVDAELIYFDKSKTAVKVPFTGTEMARELAVDMLKVTPDAENEDAAQMLAREAGSNHGNGNLAVCTARPTEQLITSMVEAKVRKRNPLLFMAVPKALTGKERKAFLAPTRRLRSAQIVAYTVESTEDATEVSVG